MPDRDKKEAFVGVLFEQANLAMGFCGQFDRQSLRNSLAMAVKPDFWTLDGSVLNEDMPIWNRCIGRLVELMLKQKRDETQGLIQERIKKMIRVLLYATIEARAHPYCWVEVSEGCEPQMITPTAVLRGLSLQVHDINARSSDEAMTYFRALDQVRACEARHADPTRMDAYSPVAGHA